MVIFNLYELVFGMRGILPEHNNVYVCQTPDAPIHDGIISILQWTWIHLHVYLLFGVA